MAWTVITIYLLFLPDTASVTSTVYFEGMDKLAHFILFYLWCLLLFLSGRFKSSRNLWIVFFFAFFLAFLSEWVQSWMPKRKGDLLDFTVDLIGIGLGLLTGYFAKKELLNIENKFDK